jgi:hypothetical protein
VSVPDELDDMAQRAREAAAASAGTAHVDDERLARMRSDDDSPDLDHAYRHVASCEACRARLIEPGAKLVERVVVAIHVPSSSEVALRELVGRLDREGSGASEDGGAHQPALTARGPGRLAVLAAPEAAGALEAALDAARWEHASSKPALVFQGCASAPRETEAWAALAAKRRAVTRAPRRRAAIVAAACAASALAALLAFTLVRTTPQPIAVVQRTYSGMMGDSDAASGVRPEDRDVELTVAGGSIGAAALFVVDARGRDLAAPRRFMRDADGVLRLVLAPRTFAAHEGAAFGLVVAGADDAVGAVLGRPPPTVGPVDATLDAFEARLRALPGIRVSRVVISDASSR